MPMSRKTSIERWLVMCARGVLAVHRYLVTMMLSTPSVDRNSAADAPAGPDPTISTSVVTVAACGGWVSAIPSFNCFTFHRSVDVDIYIDQSVFTGLPVCESRHRAPALTAPATKIPEAPFGYSPVC